MKGLDSLVVYRELEKQKEDSASEIARRKQEAEAAVSLINTHTTMTISIMPTQKAIYQGRYVVFLCYCVFGFQVLLMQESVKRIIDAEESKMGLWKPIHFLYIQIDTS